MDHQRDDELITIERALAEHLEGTIDKIAHARLATHLILAPEAMPPNSADRFSR